MAQNDPIMASMPGRYATALFELAKDKGQLQDVESDLNKFQGMLNDSSDLARVVNSPVFSAGDQLKAITVITAKAGISGPAAKFLQLIAKNRRLFAVPEMIAAFEALASRERGEVSAEVESAHPLSQSQMRALRGELKAAVGKDVQLTAKVVPSLLGGLRVKMGSRMIDTSLRTKLNNLKVAMKEVG